MCFARLMLKPPAIDTPAIDTPGVFSLTAPKKFKPPRHYDQSIYQICNIFGTFNPLALFVSILGSQN